MNSHLPLLGHYFQNECSLSYFLSAFGVPTTAADNSKKYYFGNKIRDRDLTVGLGQTLLVLVFIIIIINKWFSNQLFDEEIHPLEIQHPKDENSRLGSICL